MLEPIETIALSKAIKDTAAKQARGQIKEGHHDVNFTVRVSGPLLVAPPVPTKVKETLPPDLLVGLVLAELKPLARQKIYDAVKRTLAKWLKTGEAPDVASDSADVAQQLVELGQRETDGKRAGNVTAPLTVELVVRG
jgi:hypothetical protein